MRKEIIEIENRHLKPEIDDFEIGDTVRVSVSIIEGAKTRVQDFEGVVIARKHKGVRETLTVRKISYGVGVERIFPLHSPRVQAIKVTRKGKVRRAKLYYLRDRVGKKARLKEGRLTKPKDKLTAKEQTEFIEAVEPAEETKEVKTKAKAKAKAKVKTGE